MRVVEFLRLDGSSPFEEWFSVQDAQAAARIVVQLNRLEAGNLTGVKSVGDGVLEARIDWGPGYRLYLGREGQELIVLLAGGTKRRQQADIDTAKVRWKDYKARKRG